MLSFLWSNIAFPLAHLNILIQLLAELSNLLLFSSFFLAQYFELAGHDHCRGFVHQFKWHPLIEHYAGYLFPLYPPNSYPIVDISLEAF